MTQQAYQEAARAGAGVESVEARRLEALDRLDILDTAREEPFDRLVRLMRNIFNVPMAIVSVIDAHRQWYKAAEGVGVSEVARKDSFCRHVIADPQMLIVSDTLTDARFADHAMVLGDPHIRFYAGAPLMTPDGHAIGTICLIDSTPRAFTADQRATLGDIAALTSHLMTLRESATTDFLTGIMSRRAFREGGEKALLQALRHRQPLSCVMFDLDHFKSINDTLGHAAGDDVLKAVAAGCRAILQRSDLFGRIGGEEFALLLPQTGQRDAVGVAERLRGAIEQQSVRLGSETRQVTASFGVAAIDQATRDLDALLANADAALYRAKASGRNRTVEWPSTGSAPEPAPRRRVLKSGRIVFNNRMSTVDCTVRSLGPDGAGLDVTSTFGVPDRFILRIPSDSFEAQCRVIAQTERHIEAEFA